MKSSIAAVFLLVTERLAESGYHVNKRLLGSEGGGDYLTKDSKTSNDPG